MDHWIIWRHFKVFHPFNVVAFVSNSRCQSTCTDFSAPSQDTKAQGLNPLDLLSHDADRKRREMRRLSAELTDWNQSEKVVSVCCGNTTCVKQKKKSLKKLESLLAS